MLRDLLASGTENEVVVPSLRRQLGLARHDGDPAIAGLEPEEILMPYENEPTKDSA
jgi:hypothetical protein